MPHPVTDYLMQDGQLFERQGAVVESWRYYRGRRLGPYFRLAYRTGGRQRSLYLGSDRALAATVQEVLADLQAPVRQARDWHRQQSRMRRALRHQKQQWEIELRRIGLYAKGYEVRGFSRQPGKLPKGG